MKIEMHAHTSDTSLCAHISAVEMVSLYRQAGYDMVIVTDHYNKWMMDQKGLTQSDDINDHFLRGYKEAVKYADESLKILLGCEVSLTESPNDYLLYGVSEQFFYDNPYLYNLTLEELSKLCHDNGILIIQAHPNRAYCEQAQANLLDGAEVFNGNPRHNSNNDITNKWAVKNRFIMTSGSDFHEYEDLGTGGIVTDRTVNDINDIVNILKQGTYQIIKDSNIVNL